MKALLTRIEVLCTRKNRLKLLFVFIFLLCSFTINAFGVQEERAVLPAPVIFSANLPCSKCHKLNGTEQAVRSKAYHSTIRVLGHTEKEYGCFVCHDSENRNKLRLFNDRTIELAVSSELCGQCHSTNYKLWQSGLHGKVVGKWDGPKKYTPCTTCHDPHRPGYRTQQPEPPPTPPEKTLRWQK
jgi:uncharacterized CHY-type Zn-finger protein